MLVLLYLVIVLTKVTLEFSYMEQEKNIQVSADQAFYDDEPIGSRSGHEKWMREIEFYFSSYEKRLNKSLFDTNGIVVELGAGSCGLSACLSRLANVKHVYSLDISQVRMKKMVGISSEILGGDVTKIETIASNFNAQLPFEDNSLDAVFFDAALHHTRSMWDLLCECNRVLKKGGLLIAQREAYLSALRARGQLKRLMKTPEVAASVSENIYLFEQYEYYLRVNGFAVEFLPRTPDKIKSLLGFFNRILFCDGVLWCKKT